jgi:type IV pilus assembly protein PilX
MKPLAARPRHLALERRQRGVVMFVAMVVLIVMTLAGIAMIRQMGAGLSIAGNLAFKQNATSAADRGTETARAWAQAQAPNLLFADDAANGYFATWQAAFDPSTHDWANQARVVTGAETTVNEVRYVMHRLCANTGDPVGANCVAGPDPVGRSTSGRPGPAALTPPLKNAYFRVTTRVVGPRNTVSYTQVIMN